MICIVLFVVRALTKEGQIYDRRSAPSGCPSHAASNGLRTCSIRMMEHALLRQTFAASNSTLI